MTDRFIKLLLSLPIAVLTVWVCMLEVSSNSKETVYIAADGYDPRDLLSGHYIMLKLNWNETDCAQFESNKCPKSRFEDYYKYYVSETDAPKIEREIENNLCLTELEFAYHMNKNIKPQVIGLKVCDKKY